MRRPSTAALAGNPILIGAVTTLVVVVAVFLAYNANQGLPFVPTFQLNVEAPGAQRLVVGNEVREGGYRIGQISGIRTVRRANGSMGAMLELQLEQEATPIPEDSTILIRPRSALGMKYVDFIRGESAEALEEGGTLQVGPASIPPELDDFFNMFQPEVRRANRTNLVTFGGGLAARGVAINRTFRALPELLKDVQPVMRTLSDPDTRLGAFFDELEDAARATAPVAGTLAAGFTSMADTFEAFSRHPQELRQTIADGPETLAVAIDSFQRQQPFLRRFAAISDELRGTAAAARETLPSVNRALRVGTPVLRETPRLNEELETLFEATLELTRSPTTNLVIDGLRDTVATLTPTLRWVGPHVTVCNYWNYWWTFLADHLAERVDSGTLQRIQAKSAPSPEKGDSMTSFGAAQPANGGDVNPVVQAIEGDAPHFHGQAYGRAVNEKGEADCESGQRGYPKRLAENFPENLEIVVDPRTPGNQGPTFKGRDKVPAGQTFSAEPTGIAPPVVKDAPPVSEGQDAPQNTSGDQGGGSR